MLMAALDPIKDHLVRFRAYLGERGLPITNSILWDDEYELALYGGRWYVKIEMSRRDHLFNMPNYYSYFVLDFNHVSLNEFESYAASDDGELPWVTHNVVRSLKVEILHQLKGRFHLSGNIPYGILADRCEDDGLSAEAEVLRLPCSDTALRRWLKDRRPG